MTLAEVQVVMDAVQPLQLTGMSLWLALSLDINSPRKSESEGIVDEGAGFLGRQLAQAAYPNHWGASSGHRH